MNKLFIATPRAKGYLDGYVRSLFQTTLEDQDGPIPIVWKPLPNMAIDIARNYLVQEAQHEKCSHILWADVDATWAAMAVQRLFDRDLDIVTGAIYRRSLPPTAVWGMYRGYNKDKNHIYSVMEGMQELVDHARDMGVSHESRNDILLPETENDLMEMDGCGSHFMMVKMGVYDNIIRPYYKKTSNEAGEDFYFCRKAKEAGYKIYGDKSVHTGHEFGDGAELGIGTLLNYCRFTDDKIMGEDHLLEVGKWH